MGKITTETQRHGGRRDAGKGGRGDAGKETAEGDREILVFSVPSVSQWLNFCM
jgi:hypothetical protein